jgi:uncharacterized RmlC-like cupin family protein
MDGSCVLVRPGDTAEGVTGVSYATGVSAATTGSHRLCLELATLPPGAVGRAHLHAEHESAAYVLDGAFVLWFGDQLEQRVAAQRGDFLYIPAGVPHLPANGSSTEPAVAVLARTDPREEESAVPLPELDQLPHLEGRTEP